MRNFKKQFSIILLKKQFIFRDVQQKLLKQIMDNPDFLPAEERDRLLKEIVANLGNLDRQEKISFMSFKNKK